MIKASIIIPTYNRGKLLCNTLKNFIDHIPPHVEILIVDQSEEVSPELMETVKNHSDLVHYYKIYKKGLPHARNYGIKQATGEIIIFCDDDIIPAHDFTENHIRNYKKTDIGGVGGRILQQEKQLHLSSKLKNKNFFMRLYRSLFLRNKFTGKVRWWDAHLVDNFDAATRMYINHTQGCNMSFKRDVIQEAGGFDERFGGSAHLEETDLCLRIRKAGYKIVFDPGAEIIHLKDTKGGCRAMNSKHWFSWYGHNNMLFFLKNFNHFLLPIFIASSFLHLILSMCKRCNPMIIIWGTGGYLAGWKTYNKGTELR